VYFSDGFFWNIFSPVSFVLVRKWRSIDNVMTLGLADSHPGWRVSRRLRPLRKAAAKATGLHGVLSGKYRVQPVSTVERQHLGVVRRRLAAIDRARKKVEQATAESAGEKHGPRWKFWQRADDLSLLDAGISFVLRKNPREVLEERNRMRRVKEIDKLMQESQVRLMELACEKDVLQRRLNPLWNYTTTETTPNRTDVNASETVGLVSASRQFNFPPGELVDEYLDVLFSSGRLVKLNHTDLWRNVDEEDDEDELISPVFEDRQSGREKRKNGSGSWFLRNGLGEKLGDVAETAGYKAVCAAIMSVLARSLSSLHGVNVMEHSDIRLFMEQTPDLPPFPAGIIHGSGMSSNYAQNAIHNAMHRGAKKNRKKRSSRRRRLPEDAFLQRDAVVETLISQCQIAAPILKVFPLAWQRAFLGNIITLITSVVADFCEGVEFQILGHRLSFSFNPITEEDMIRGLVSDPYNNRRRANPEQFEAAVRATAADMGEELKFLDRWHERALGGGRLRTQIATLIARLVLTLVDDVLSGCRMDLWAAQAGGPRLVAALEYRSDEIDESSDSRQKR
jgi:hypothetical protein